ncbi:MAG: YkgJ family cysteine cluster protein [Bacteroidetes bacterium]|jgi:Fe-S-cluster containining protein|nr:YkgJ family cysteine cluster protein [Bacteroidota bacterium]
MNLEQFREKAEKNKADNKQFLSKLKKKNPRKLDEHFHDLHEEVFEEIDCLTCANCCKTTSPVFKQKDIEAISKRLKMKPSAFIDKYLHIDSDSDYVLNTAPCAFLDHENYCMIYEDRPTACREYPHTDRKKMFQLLDLTQKNTLVCPAVLEIVERLKKIEIR